MTVSPWLTCRDAAAYLKRGRAFVRKEIQAGRLRAAKLGGRGEIVTSIAWLDAYVEAQAQPVRVQPLRRGVA